MGLFSPSVDPTYRVFCFALSLALLCIAGLTVSRWSLRRLRWGDARCAARRVRGALVIATCLGYATFGLFSGLGSFNAQPPPYVNHQLALVNVSGLLLIVTCCSAIMELIVAATERRGASSPAPPRPDVGPDWYPR